MPRTFRRDKNTNPETNEEQNGEKLRTYTKQKNRDENMTNTEPIHKRNKSIKTNQESKISKFEVEEKVEKEENEEKEEKEEKKIKVASLKVKVNRPKLTDDEITQIQNDFNEMDILHEGKIKPGLILIFIDKNENFKNKSPFYYDALQKLNNKQNNLKGIDVDTFIDAVKNVINDNYDYDFDNWKEIFKIYFLGKGGKNINDKILNDTIKELGYEVSDEEIKNLIEKIGGDIDENKFISIMKTIEKKKH